MLTRLMTTEPAMNLMSWTTTEAMSSTREDSTRTAGSKKSWTGESSLTRETGWAWTKGSTRARRTRADWTTGMAKETERRNWARERGTDTTEC
jgi:hypothetical protein